MEETSQPRGAGPLGFGEFAVNFDFFGRPRYLKSRGWAALDDRRRDGLEEQKGVGKHGANLRARQTDGWAIQGNGQSAKGSVLPSRCLEYLIFVQAIKRRRGDVEQA